MKNAQLLSTFLVLAAMVAAQCSSSYTAERLPTQHLRFGSGGGFSGEVVTWTLLHNGQLFRHSRLDNTTIEWKQHSRRQGRVLFREAEALQLLDRPPFLYPGNMYRFLEWTDGARVQRITWGSREHPVDSAIEALHERLMALTRER